MTPNHDDMTDNLGRALHERADGVGAPLTLSDVKGRATRIRRRRAIAATAAAAAAVAIIVPTAIAGSDMFDTSDSGGGQIANPGESDGPPNDESWPQELDTSDLPIGDAPGIPWRENGVLHGAEGDPGVDYAFTRYDDGWLAVEPTPSGYTALILDASGNVIRESPTTEGFAVSDDASEVLWMDGDALTLHDNDTGEDVVIGTDLGDEVTPQVVEDGTAYYRVRLAGESWPEGRWWADGVEHRPEAGQPIFGWGDVNDEGYVLAMTSVDDFGSCWTVQTPEGGSLGETCDFSLEEFSPSGDYILADSAYADGLGDRQLAVLTVEDGAISKDAAVLHYLGRLPNSPTLTDYAWEDESHILAISFTPSGTSAKGTWQLLRIGLDGTVENAVEPVEATDLNGPFALS